MKPNKTQGNYLRSISFKNYLGSGHDLKLRLFNNDYDSACHARFITGPNGWGKTTILRVIRDLLSGCDPDDICSIADSCELKLTKGSIKWVCPTSTTNGSIEKQGIDIPDVVFVPGDYYLDVDFLPSDEKAMFDDWIAADKDRMNEVYKKHGYSDGYRRLAAIIHAAVRSRKEGKILLIDDVEAHLHPALLIDLSRKISGMTDQSILCTTHSVEAFNCCLKKAVDLWEELEEDGKDKDKDTDVSD